VPEANADLVQGTLDMLILKTLALEPRHGFGIAQRVEQISRGVFQVNPGSLFRPSAGSSGPAGSKASGARPRTTEGHAITS
jgi:hypothetical protein